MKVNTNNLWYGLALIVLCGLNSCAPVAQFDLMAERTTFPPKYKFMNQSERAQAYRWDFGDGDSSIAEAPYHLFGQSGQYDVTLTALGKRKSTTFTKTITVEAPSKCMVVIETTYGKMFVELYDATPKHRDNFLKLTEEQFFDGLLFHRVIDGFMVQGGDPNSRNASPNAQLGSGGPGYQVDAEFVDTLHHFKGALAAARQGDMVNPKRASSGSQFYIVQGGPVTDQMLDQIEVRNRIQYTEAAREAYKKVGGTPFLDNQYTVFGRVVEGLDVIDKIAKVKTRPGDRPIEDVVMKIYVAE